MSDAAPFVVTVASEKGGVGKTTIATNLAVYLKGLREDLPVTIVSFDNHFSVDAMFAIGGRTGGTVGGWLRGEKLADLVQLGEYGVQFLASERDLGASPQDPARLRTTLAGAELGGILLLDTRPILDNLTRAALGAADLVLTPVRDRPSLVNAATIVQALSEEGGAPDDLWVIPSLIDARLRLRDEVGLREFLEFSARERGYQVAPTAIAKSPKVEGLATSFSRRVYPVLTHARATVVHRQFRDLASFVLEAFDRTRAPRSRRRQLQDACAGMPRARRARLRRDCPLCGEPAGGEGGWFFEDTGRRRQGLLHLACLENLLAAAGVGELAADVPLVALVKPDPGWEGSSRLHFCGFRESGRELDAESSCGPEVPGLAILLRGMTGRLPEELPATFLLLADCGHNPGQFFEREGYRRFRQWRRAIFRQLRGRFGK